MEIQGYCVTPHNLEATIETQWAYIWPKMDSNVAGDIEWATWLGNS